MSKYIVTASALTVREGPGSTYRAIGYLKEGDVVDTLGSSADNTWIKVQTPNGLIGWCSSKYLSPTDTNPLPGPSTYAGSYSVKSIALFMHEGPASKYRVVGILKKGITVEALGFSLDGSWIKVRNSGGTTGWCASKYMAENKSPDSTGIGMHRLTKTTINIYKGPSLELSIIGQATATCLVNATEISPDRAWKKIVTNLGYTGWCQAEFLVNMGEMGRAITKEEFPWMPIAFQEMGVREYPGSSHNPRIQEYLASTVLGSGPALSDETHWCAAFVNWCVEKAGIPSNNSPMVSSWTRWGQALQIPRRGCVVTFKWEDGGGHVGFYMGEIDQKICTLGGNQYDGVWIMLYPSSTVSAYRIPANWPTTL